MNRRLYKAGIRLVPGKRTAFSPWTGQRPGPELEKRLLLILKSQKVRGGTLALSDGETVSCAAFGSVRRDGSVPAAPDTFYRAASVSKFVTAWAALRLNRAGKLPLDVDIGAFLPYPVRNPRYPDREITLAMLLSHTSSIVDGQPYLAGLAAPPPASRLLTDGGCFAPWAPGEKWDYSNFAAGLAGCVMEGALHQPFQTIMKETVFDPLGIPASFRPGDIGGTLADAWRLFPPARRPGYDARARQEKDRLSPARPDPEADYLFAHGSLCVRAGDLLRIGQDAVMSELFPLMKRERASFGARDRRLREGLGTFLYRDPSLPCELYGHQGLAYGAVHGLFLNEKGEGFALLTSAASEERAGVMTELNIRLCAALFPDGRCRPW